MVAGMKQQEKQLLLKDLCGRLPYGVICHTEEGDGHLCSINQTIFGTEYGLNISPLKRDYFNDSETDEQSIKPYLRQLSSMTEEELRDFAKTKYKDNALWEIVEFPEMKCYKGFINVRCKNKNKGDTWIFQVNTRTPLETYWGLDWLNAHHFDYRGLIEKGLALKAPEGMYKTE